MRITAFSDTHMLHQRVEIPDGDLLIFAGDMSVCRTLQDVAGFNTFLKSLPHPYKVVIGGNHDHLLASSPDLGRELLRDATYLQDESVIIEGIKIHGSPWQPIFNTNACDAFALPRGGAILQKWDLIPEDTDILITHSPPAGIMDEDGGASHGCSDLLHAVQRIKPTFHIFGHIHNHNGIQRIGCTTFVNCNVKDKNNRVRPALTFDYPSR
ncbi:metallophosphatase domain-containing protein [Desulfocapsa sulfexigens]|nr:metallophosphatase domain-containing protein [Desulfocapsa sulfexigens]